MGLFGLFIRVTWSRMGLRLILLNTPRDRNRAGAGGVTQEQVYNDTGIHIARIEQGKRDISYTTLVKLAQYFEVGLERL